MKSVNIPSGAERNTNVGLVWREVVSNGNSSDTFRVQAQGSFRVSSGADGTTVTVAGVLAMTMRMGEVVVFNAGVGEEGDTRTSVEVVVAGTDYRVQVAEENERYARRRK